MGCPFPRNRTKPDYYRQMCYKNVSNSNISEGPSGGSCAAAAVADGCRKVVWDDCSSSACISATTIPVAELVDIWPPISSGSACPLGYLRAETPREKDPQTLIHRDCPRWEGFPLEESEQGQTQAQLTQSTPCKDVTTPIHILALYMCNIVAYTNTSPTST